MKCKQCGGDLERNWKFCAYCGKEKKFFDVFKKKPLTQEEEMMKMIKPLMGILKLSGFPGKFKINIKQGNQDVFEDRQDMFEERVPGAVKQKVANAPVKESDEYVDKPRKVTEILEPITKTTKVSKGTKHVLVIPGVKSPKDIKIRQFQESIEIKAYAKDKAFFKVIPISPNAQIIDKKYQDEMLKLVVG